MMRSLLCLVLLTWAGQVLAADDWPMFRGPRGDGTAAARDLPLTWTDKDNVVWTAKMPGPGSSSPIVSGDRVYVTGYSGYGPNVADFAQLKRHLVCLDKATGKVLWQADEPARLPESKWGMPIAQHGYATSTPLADGERVYAFFGKSGVIAYSPAGKELWRADVGALVNEFGSGSSPVPYRDLLLVNASVEGGRLVALERATGKVAWRLRLRSDSWTTPLLVDVPGGGTEVVLATRNRIYGIDPDKGTELWTVEYSLAGYPGATPVARGGVVYVMGSNNEGRHFLAIKAGGRGDVSETHVLWKKNNAGASHTSPLLVGDYLYFYSGLATCLKAADGAVVYQERLAGLGTEYASPVAVGDKIYLFTRRGDGHVLATGPKFAALAKSTFGADEGFVASPAVSGERLYVRSGATLWCLGKK